MSPESRKSCPGPIELTPEEAGLVRDIGFGASLSHEAPRASCAAAGKLARLLLNRNAIPDVRWRHFTDPELNIGVNRSRKEVFESNGTRGDAILSHGNFLPHLRYFVFGPGLPRQVIEDFYQAVLSAGYLTGGDLEPLRIQARLAVRAHALEPRRAREEFFKLALECGVSPMYARSIRDAIRGAR